MFRNVQKTKICCCLCALTAKYVVPPPQARRVPWQGTEVEFKKSGSICEISEAMVFNKTTIHVNSKVHADEVSAAIGSAVKLGKRPDTKFIPKTYPEGCVKLLQQCWAENAARRPCFSEVVRQLKILMDCAK